MTQGVVMFGNKIVGTFEVKPYPHEELIVKFKEGLRVGATFEAATEVGNPLRLVTI
jgi:hypothetical protein